MTAASMSTSLSAEQSRALEVARGLARSGVPVFRAMSNPSKKIGFDMPAGWERTKPGSDSIAHIDAWAPGDALAAVMGHVVDLLDADPRNGSAASMAAIAAAGAMPRSYGHAETPSGGTHDLIAALGVGGRDLLRPGVDIKGGIPDQDADGKRGCMFIAPTVRVSKVDGQPRPYRWLVEPSWLVETPDGLAPDLDMLDELADDRSGFEIAEMIRRERSDNVTPLPLPGNDSPFARPWQLRTFTTAQAEAYITEKLDALRAAPQGNINHALNGAAYLIGHFVPAVLSVQVATRELLAAQLRPWHDNDDREARASIRSGLKKGMSEPYSIVPEAATRVAQQAEYEVLSTPAKQTTDAKHVTEAGDEFVPDDEDEPEADRPTWARVDLDDILAGRYERPMPTVMAREDGACLFYAGKVNALYGESESGKSWVMQWATAELLKAGKDVLYVDFEDDPGSIVNRLLDMGVPAAEIRKHFDYRAPERSPASVLEIDSWWDMLARPCVLAVIDGVTDSMGIFGKKINDNDEVGDWFRTFPTLLAKRTGAAVVIIDHVSKDSEHRGRFAIGAQHKLSSIKGAAYLVDIVDVLGVGRCGVMTLRVTKDRPGQVRGRSGPQRKTDRTQETARFVLDSTGARPQARLTVWEAAPTGPDGEFRPTGVMQSVSEFLEHSPDVSQSVVEKSVRGRAEIVRQALDILAREGFVERRRVSNTQHRWFSNRPYRQVDDPAAGVQPPRVTTLDSQAEGATSSRRSCGEEPVPPPNLLVQSRPAVNLPVSVTDVLESDDSEGENMIHNPVPPRPVASGTGLDVDPQPRPVGSGPVGDGATGTGVVERPAERDAGTASEPGSEAEGRTPDPEPPCPCGRPEYKHSRASWRVCRNGHRWHAFGRLPLKHCPWCPEPTPDGDAA